MLLLQALIFCLVLLSSVNAQGEGAIRLVRNNLYSTTQAYTSGIVEVYYNGAWGNICYDSYLGYTEANVICHQLGFTGVSTYGRTGMNSTYGNDTNPMAMEDVECLSSNYLSLLSQCIFTPAYSLTCVSSDSYDLYVACYTTRIWDNPYNGQIRLLNGTYSNQGRLEVYCNGQWGTVCDDTFDLTAAGVACNQLGYNTYSRYDYTNSLAGSSSQPIWLDNLLCTGSYCLSSCQTCPSTQYHDCTHSEDVALECEYSSIESTTATTLKTCSYETPTFPTNTLGAIIGGAIAGFCVLACITAAVSIGIPLCICCCIGVGVGSAARRRNPNVGYASSTGVGRYPAPAHGGYSTAQSYPTVQQQQPYSSDQYFPAQPNIPPPAYYSEAASTSSK